MAAAVVFELLAPSRATAAPSTISDCAVALVPQVKITTLDERTKYAWLNIVSEKTYESAKTAIKGSGDVKLLDLIKIGDAEASYEQFNEKRREYLRVNKGEYDHALALSIFTQSLPSEAYGAWTKCVDDVTRATGLHAWFQEDTRGTAVLYVRYYEGPGRTTKVHVTVQGAKEKEINVTLDHDAVWVRLLTRTQNKAITATVSDNRFSDHATSAVPSRSDVGLVVSPYVLTQLAAKPCAAAKPCDLCVESTAITVEAPDVHHPDAMLVVDSADKRSMPQEPQPFHDQRELADVFVAGAGSVQVVIAGRVGQIASLAPFEGCKAPTMLLRNSRVIVKKPEPVIQAVVTGPFTQDITLRKYGEFTMAFGNVGCPNCHEAWVAPLIVREAGLPVTIDRFEKIEVISDIQSGHFYSCTDGVCGIKHPDFTQLRTGDSPSCIGTSTCWVWRHADDSHQATQVFRVTYYKTEQKCVKNCD